MRQPVKGLRFKKSIVATAKDPISTKELLIRLQSLSDELSAVDQENTDVNLFKQIERDVANKKLLTHNNAGVQAYLCCSISDLLRITAPNAPFTAGELSMIFRLFFKQLKKLSDPDNTYFQQQCYLLKRLAEVRSIILITDLPDGEELTQIAFETFYDSAARNFPAKLEPLAADILSEIISESENIPHKVLSLILDKFISNSIESSAIAVNSRLNIYSPGLNFSIQICEQNIDRMSRQIAQYFSEILYNSNSMYGSKEDIIPNSSKQDRLQQMHALERLQKIHDLSIQIWKYVPELLSSVMGLIDDELNADEVKIRVLATETIGRMIGSLNYVSGSFTNKVNFFISHKDTWGNWLRKTTDVSYQVRAKWVEQLPPIVNCVNSSTSDVSEALRKCLHKCLLDSDENVRLAACKSIRQFSFDDFTNKICKANIMNTLGHLTREKNSEIRNQAINILAEVYDKYMKYISSDRVIDFGNITDQENNQLKDIILKDIPNHILSLVYINDRNINSTVDLTLFEKLLPIAESNSSKRIDRLLQLYNNLDEKSKQSFLAINKRQQKVANAIKSLVELCEELRGKKSIEEKENNQEELKSSEPSKKQQIMIKLEKIFKWLCTSFPDGINTYNCLNRFVKLEKARYLYLLKICISPESDYNTIRNFIKELLVKLSDSKNLKVENDTTNILASDMVSNFKLLLIRGSVLLYNKSNVVELLNHSKDKNHEWHLAANNLLEQISLVIPDVFKLHMSSLVDLVILSQDNASAAKSHNLRTIYYLVKTMPDHFPKSYEFLEALKSISLSGSPKEAKYAVRILGASGRKELFSSQIVESIFPLDLKCEQFATHLSVIAELYLVDPPSIMDKSSELTSLLIKEVFLKNRDINPDSLKTNSDWLSSEILDNDYKLHSTLNEKLIAIKIFVNKLIALEQEYSNGSDDMKEKLTEQGSPVFKLLVSFIGNAGEIINKKSPTWPTPELHKSRLRLAAGLSIIKLAKYPAFNEMIYPTTIRRLTFLLSDPILIVRQEMLSKLHKYLINDAISERFISVIFFCAKEPVSEVRNNASMWIKSLHKRDTAKHGIKFEKSLVRIIHIMSHHEHFMALMGEISGEAEQSRELTDTRDEKLIKAYDYATDFLIFYLNLIAGPENVSLLYYFASRVKQHRDATLSSEVYDSEPNSAVVLNLYRVAELAQLIIKEYCDLKNWPMQTWPGKLKLPTDIFSQMSSTKEVQNVITTVFIPDKIQISLQISLKKKLAGSAHKRIPEVTSRDSAPKKLKLNKPGENHKKKRKLKEVSEPSNSPNIVRKSSRQTKNVNYTEEGEASVSASSDYDDLSS